MNKISLLKIRIFKWVLLYSRFPIRLNTTTRNEPRYIYGKETLKRHISIWNEYLRNYNILKITWINTPLEPYFLISTCYQIQNICFANDVKQYYARYIISTCITLTDLRPIVHVNGTTLCTIWSIDIRRRMLAFDIEISCVHGADRHMFGVYNASKSHKKGLLGNLS